MSNDKVLEQLKIIISQGTRDRINVTEINADVDLIAEMGLDSLEALEISLMIEEAFSIHIDDEDLNRELFRRLDNLVDYIKAKACQT